MAEKDPLDKLEEQLKCAVCLDTYTDPKVLLCNHAYCVTCIDLLAHNSRSIACPNCREVTPIPKNGVKALQPAFRINNLFEIKESLEKKAKGATAGVAVSHCNEHGDEEVKLYCETCEKLICFQCVIKGAKHHKCEYGMITELIDKYKGEIMTSLEPVKKNLGTIDNAVELLAVRSEEITDLCDVVRASIKDTIQQLQEALNVRQTQLLDQLQQVADKKLTGLSSQTDAIKAVHAQLEQCCASVEEKLETSSKEEIVSIKSKLVREIEEANSFFEPDILIPSTEADIKFTSSAEATRICQSSGSLSASELRPDPTQCYATGTGLEAAEVGETASVVVHTVNVWGNPCEAEMLECRLVPEITRKSANIYDKHFRGDQVEVNYTPKVKGQHQLHVEIDNRHIKGSPFTVRVKSIGYGDQIATFDADRPWGIVVNHKNEIIVSEHKKHCVSVFHPSGQKLCSFGSRGSEVGQFNLPYGVAVDDVDNIMVADLKNNRVQKFSADGRFLRAVGTGQRGALGFSGPRDIAFNPFNKKLYVVDRSRDVQILNSDFSFAGMFMGYHGLFGGGGSECWGVECDRYGKVYIAIVAIFGQISVFSAEGTLLVKSLGNLGLTGCPFSIAIDSRDTLFVSDYKKHEILSFNLHGESLGRYGKGGLNCSQGVAIGDCDVLYVCENGSNRISIF